VTTNRVLRLTDFGEARAEKEKMLKQLKAGHDKSIQAKNLELNEKDKAIMEMRTTGRTERPKEDGRRDSHVTKEMSRLMSTLGPGGEVEKEPERKTGRTDSSVQREVSDIMAC